MICDNDNNNNYSNAMHITSRYMSHVTS